MAVEHVDLPGKVRRNAPNSVPAVLMGRLAIDTRARGTGLGRVLVRDAILSTLAAGGLSHFRSGLMAPLRSSAL